MAVRLRKYNNPAGWLGSNPQGGGGLVPFSACDIIDENFDAGDPLWAETAGTNTVTFSGGEWVIDASASGSILEFASNNEIWAMWDFSVDSAGLSFPASARIGGSGFSPFGGNAGITLGIINDAGTVKFYSQYFTDGGTVSTTHDTPAFSLDTAHHVVANWKESSGPGANDGVVQLFVDNEELISLSDVDSDTAAVNRILMGNTFTSGTVTATMRGDNVCVGNTGGPAVAGFLLFASGAGFAFASGNLLGLA